MDRRDDEGEPLEQASVFSHESGIEPDWAAFTGFNWPGEIAVDPNLHADADLPEAERASTTRKAAENLGLIYIETIDERQIVMREQECLAMLRRSNPIVQACVAGEFERPSVVLGPNRIGMRALEELRGRNPLVKDRFCLTDHRKLRAALLGRVTAPLTRYATHGLFDAAQAFSAWTVFTTRQAILFSLFVLVLAESIWFFPSHVLTALRVMATILFVGNSVLRIVAAWRGRDPAPYVDEDTETEYPIYSVLVPLYREAALVPQLLTALARLDWPRDRLEIKLICEADDHETVGAIKAHDLDDIFELIEVPPSLPRTKPKALRYALPVTLGEYVVLYDAEDIPHPMQLRQAWHHFQRSGDDLACLQAPLEIGNASVSWVARMFAVEYAGLFRTLLPWLASTKAILPLGGTSSHFRRSVLEEVGGWDPHNVTEDADLGVRLRRLGYRCDVISLPTLEDAPETVSVWLNQRTRWCKGWLQTWLVHMRQPVILAKELGMASFLISQLLLFGIVFSVLVHPLFLVTLGYFGWSLLGGHQLDTVQAALLALDLFNIVCGYVGFLGLGYVSLSKGERRGFWRTMLLTPAYWLLMSVAAWRAVFELWWRPFHWNKTPHAPSRRGVLSS